MVNREVEASKLDSSFPRKCQHCALNVGWGGDLFQPDMPLRNFLAPVERMARSMKRVGVKSGSQQHHAHIESFHDLFLVNSGCVGEDLIVGQSLLRNLESL